MRKIIDGIILGVLAGLLVSITIAQAVSPTSTIQIVDHLGNVMSGVASAATASANSTVQVVNSAGSVLDSIFGVLQGEQNVAAAPNYANPRTVAVVSTTAVTNGTTAVTLGAANGFINNEGIAIYGAGANCNINSTDCGSITVGQATVVQTGYTGANGGTTQTYVYQCTATDAAYGAPAAGAASVSVNGPVVLSEPNTAMGSGAVGTGGNYNTVTCPTVTGAVHYVWWRNTAGGGNKLWALTDTNTLIDWINHQSYDTNGPFNNTPPVAAQADVLATTVASGGGTTSIVLTAAATQTGTFPAWPDATAAFQGAYNTLTGGGGSYAPAGFYKVRTITPKHGVFLRGAGGAINATNLSTVIQGTPGYDVFSFAPSTADAAFGFRDFKITSGRDGFATNFPANGGAVTAVIMDNLMIGTNYANIFVAGSIEEWWVHNMYLTGGWYGIDMETTAQAASNTYIQKSSFDDVHYNGQQVNGIHISGVTQLISGVTFKRTTVQGALQDGVWVEAPTSNMEFEGFTDEGIGSDFTRVTRLSAASPCTATSNVIAMSNTTGLAIGQDFTAYGCGANSNPLEGTICALVANTSVTLQDAACSVNQNAGTTQTSAVTTVNAPFDNLLWITNGGTATGVGLYDASFASSGGCCGQTQTRYQIYDRTAGIIGTNVAAANIAYPASTTQIFGNATTSNVIIHPSLAAGNLTPGQFSLGSGLVSGGANFSLITSGDGGDFDVGMVDTTANGSGTYGQFRLIKNDSGRNSIFQVDGTSAHIAWKRSTTGNTPTVLLNGCGTIAAGNVTSGTDVVGTETTGTTTTSCAIQFATAFPTAPVCLCDDQTTHANFLGCSATTAVLTVTLTSNTGDVIKWWCPANS